MIEMIKISINEHLMDNVLKDVINENKLDIYNQDDNIKYQITSSFNQMNKIYDNISTIVLGECESKLKEIYKIDQSETLIILKYDYILERLLVSIVGYEVFHPLTKETLDLNHCKNMTINIYYLTRKHRRK